MFSTTPSARPQRRVDAWQTGAVRDYMSCNWSGYATEHHPNNYWGPDPREQENKDISVNKDASNTQGQGASQPKMGDASSTPKSSMPVVAFTLEDMPPHIRILAPHVRRKEMAA